MSKPRRDRTYPKPKQTRHAWYLEDNEPGRQPRQVLIIAWRRHSYRWAARIVYCVEVQGGEPAVVDCWVPAETLRPVPADPNRAYRLR